MTESGLSGLASRLYRGDANLNIVGRRKLWFGVAGVVALVAIIAMIVPGFTLGTAFSGGNDFTVSAKYGDLKKIGEVVGSSLEKVAPSAEVISSQTVGGDEHSIRTTKLDEAQTAAAKAEIAKELGIDAKEVIDNRVSASWGKQVTQQALIGLVVFLVLVSAYLVIRFEWRMALAAVASLIFDLLATAAVYALVGFEVTPSTVIGFLTILGFALYDVVVVFDKVQENTRSITGSSTQTYAEATNLALNQTFMRSINTSLVALLPVGGLLFIGAGLLGAGTLKDLGLVLFIGMGTAVYSSLFFASPVLVWLKEMDPKIANHTQRVLTRRGLIARSDDLAAGTPTAAPVLAGTGAKPGAVPKAGAKPARPGQRPGGKRR